MYGWSELVMKTGQVYVVFDNEERTHNGLYHSSGWREKQVELCMDCDGDMFVELFSLAARI